MNKQGIIYGVLSATLFGISGILASILFHNQNINPEWLVGVRMISSGLILLLLSFCFLGRRVFEIWLNKKDIILIILYGIVGVLLAQSSFFLSVYFGDAATATILQSLGPTIIVILLSLAKRTLPSRLDTWSILIALTGVFLLITNGNINQLVVNYKALFWGILSAFGLAAYTLIPKPLLKKRSPFVIVAWGLLVGGIAENFFHPIWYIPSQVSTGDWIIIIFIIIAGTLLSYALYVMSLSQLKPTTASLLSTIEPMVATLLSVTLLHVHLMMFQVVGIIFIISTIFLISVPLERIFKKRISDSKTN
ncbi:EamA family transporter [Leuconostoc koreense]|nr:EamA family transporter [Leuconostoc mesenteroides]QGM25395.1 EamA family transporter [Leuconostoc mesenteroides subsp. mesenteroides]